MESTKTFASGRFELRARVGEGAVGVVYDAYDHVQNARVALKTLRTLQPSHLLSLKNEFRSIQDVRHPNLVSYGELIEDAGEWSVTMEFIDGTTFRQHVRSGNPAAGTSSPPVDAAGPARLAYAVAVDERRLRDALAQLANGLLALHQASIVHRDIKPSNVLVTREGRVVILDFGVAGDIRTLMEDDGIVGTARYMAPEQALGEAVGFPADWYAVGVLLYEALTGTVPFRGTLMEIAQQKLEAAVTSPTEVDPGVPPDLAALCVDLMRADPEARPDGFEVLRRVGARPGDDEPRGFAKPIFVGRASELAALAEAAGAARAAGVTVLVHGESGVGKSYLVRHFVDDLAGEGCALVLAGRCYERESVRYKGVDGAVDALSRALRTRSDEELAALLPEDVHLVADLFPVLADVAARGRGERQADSSPLVNPHQTRLRAFKGVRELLTRMAGAQPVVLVIDDVQWADADSLALLTEVVRPPSPPGLLLVATVRVGEEIRVPTFPGDVRHVRVEPLPEEDATALVLRLAGGQGLDAADVRAVADEARGHPLFIDELVRQRRQRGAGGAPLRLDEALWARVSALEPKARRVLEVIAVAGVPTAHDVIAETTDLTGEVTFITSALRAAHLVRTTGSALTDAVEPYHDRVRESVLAHLAPDTKRAWHERLATALERREGTDAQAVAVHWQGAGDDARAAVHAERAGDAAARGLAFDRAATQYRLTLSLGTALTEEQVRAVKTKLAEALTNAHRYAEAAQTRLDLAGDAWDVGAINLRRRAAEQFLCSGHFDRGLVLLRDVLAHLGLFYPRAPFLVILSLLVMRAMLRLRGVGYVRKDPAQIDPAALVRVDTLRSAGSGFAMTDNIRGAYFQTRALLEARKVGDPNRLIHALSVDICFTSTGGGRTQRRTRQLLEKARAMGDSLQTDFARACVHEAAGYAHYMVGEWRGATASLGEAERLFRDRVPGSLFEVNAARTMLFRALVYRGEMRELAARMGPALREVIQIGDIQTEINLRATGSMAIALLDDEPERAAAEVTLARGHLARSSFLVQHYFCLVGEMQVAMYRGDGRAALAILERDWRAVKRSMLLRVETLRTTTLEHRARASLWASLQAGGSPAHADAYLKSARRDADALARIGMPWALAYAEQIGACIASLTRSPDAADRFARATAQFEAAGMGLHAAVARRREGELRGGATGARLVGEANTWMRAQGVKSPAAVTRLYAPAMSQSASETHDAPGE